MASSMVLWSAVALRVDGRWPSRVAPRLLPWWSVGGAAEFVSCGGGPRRRLRPLAVSGSVTANSSLPRPDGRALRCEEGGAEAAPVRAGGGPAARGVVGRLNQARRQFLRRTTRTRSFLALCCCATSLNRAAPRVGAASHGQGALRACALAALDGTHRATHRGRAPMAAASARP